MSFQFELSVVMSREVRMLNCCIEHYIVNRKTSNANRSVQFYGITRSLLIQNYEFIELE